MKRVFMIVLILATVLALVGCDADPQELGEALVDAAMDKGKDFVDSKLDEAKGEAVSFFQPLIDGWNGLKSLFVPKVTQKDGKYYANGEEVTNVTIDTVAEAVYRRSFNSCSKKERKAVICQYAGYMEFDPVLLDFIEQVEPNSGSIDWEEWDAIEDVMLLGSTDFALLKLHAEAKHNNMVKTLFKELSDQVGVAEKVYQVVKTIFLLKDLENNDISDPEEYCTELIAAMDGLTSFIDPVGYFSAGLSVVSEGVELLVENYEKWNNKIRAYGDSIKGTGLFIGKRWALVAEADRWQEFAEAQTRGDPEPDGIGYLSLADIRKFHADLDNIKTETERELIEAYIVFRLQYELGIAVD